MASPEGASIRMAHTGPLPPARCELKNRYLPSGEKRGDELSVLGLVYRTGSPPAVGTTQTS